MSADGARGPIAVTARYFAAFRERAGRDAESLTTEAGTAAELYAELARRHGFADAVTRCKVAVNDELAGWRRGAVLPARRGWLIASSSR